MFGVIKYENSGWSNMKIRIPKQYICLNEREGKHSSSFLCFSRAAIESTRLDLVFTSPPLSLSLSIYIYIYIPTAKDNGIHACGRLPLFYLNMIIMPRNYWENCVFGLALLDNWAKFLLSLIIDYKDMR